MKLILTKDGSSTFKSEKYDETYHSVTGALEEAEKKFIEPCGIKDGMNILDIGFGLGYNVGMAMHKAKNLKIISLEKDSSVLEKIQSLTVPIWFGKTYSKVKQAAKDLEYEEDGTWVDILIGDARETIKKIVVRFEEDKFDAVFLDPFSPPKNPELWDVDFFKEIKKRMKKNGILATYSCARIVRDNLKKAGFE